MIEVKMFAEDVARRIKDYMPEAYSDMQCQVMDSLKNNGVYRTGINFLIPGEQFTPLVYMEAYYDAAKGGKPIEEVMNQIAVVVEKSIAFGKNMPEISIDNFENVKKHLCVSLINTKANRRMLTEIPHVEIEDLSVICSIVMPERGEIKINNKNLSYWGIGQEQLFSAAFDNIQESDYVMQSMTEVIDSLVYNSPAPENLLERSETGEITPIGLYVLSNRERIKGASVMLCPAVMEKVGKIMPEGFYIIPSSIHEVLIISKDLSPKSMSLGSIVREVNENEVDREEVLSDQIYEYDKEQGRICRAPDCIDKRKEMER